MNTKAIWGRVRETANEMRRLLAVAVLATGVAAVAVGCGSTPPERTAGDAIDDQAIRTVGGWPWPRQRLAQAIRELARAGASVIADPCSSAR